MGKAKQNMLLKRVEAEEERQFNWETLKGRVSAERDADGFPSGEPCECRELLLWRNRACLRPVFLPTPTPHVLSIHA